MSTGQEKGLIKIIIDDFFRFFKELFNGNLFRNIGQDYNTLKEFFFDKYRRERIEQANPLTRFFIATFWLVKMLLIKLAAFRRLLVVIALIFLISSIGGTNNQTKIFLGVMFLLLVLMLELKDKLLARQELEAGRSVQRALLPDEHQDLAGWDIFMKTIPANDVGGDLVDYIPINNRRSGIAVGDVAGKGLPAALLMAKLQATIRALLPDAKSLTNLAAQINRIFYRDSIPERFASLCLFTIEKNSGRIRIVNAGHLPPLVIRDKKVNELSKGAVALGLKSDTQYSEQEIDLDAKDIFMVYSDGVCEARNDRNEFFSESALHNIMLTNRDLSVKEIASILIDTLKEFSGDTPQFDDISFAIVKRIV